MYDFEEFEKPEMRFMPEDPNNLKFERSL